MVVEAGTLPPVSFGKLDGESPSSTICSDQVGTICGGIDGPWTQQTVPYAELVAFTEALGIAKQASELHFVIDADYVVKGWQHRAAWRKDKPHRAQWEAAKEAASKVPVLTITKIKSHLNEIDMATGEYPFLGSSNE